MTTYENVHHNFLSAHKKVKHLGLIYMETFSLENEKIFCGCTSRLHENDQN